MTMDISVLIPTRNRENSLRETLCAMACVRRAGLSVEFVVIDNGSSDATPAVLADLGGRLPLRCLSEPAPGKNHALNRALGSVSLGSIVVFTDDDVTPEETWFDAILDASRRWPTHHVFGGKITPTWPNGALPAEWARHEIIQRFAFARHDLGDAEREYPLERDPFGPNFWVRNEALRGLRFLGSIGPHPTRRKIGGETQFLRQLRRRGCVPVYAPAARVEHRIESTRLSKRSVYLRALQLGRGKVYTQGLPDEATLRSAPLAWRGKRLREVLDGALRLARASTDLDEQRRVLEIVFSLRHIGIHAEALKLSLMRDGARQLL
jgi:glycosyltransferase involved in cell wall biosynthesis